MTKGLHFKAALGRWLSLWPLPVLWGVVPAVIYLSGVFGREALLLWFCVFGATVAAAFVVARALYFARYRLTLVVNRRARQLVIRERRLRTREHVVDAATVSSVRLVLPVAGAGRAHLELELEGKEKPLSLGWELGREGNGRVFYLMQNLWEMVQNESSYYVLLRNPALDESSVIIGKSHP